MRPFAAPYFLDHSVVPSRHQVPVKTEASASPDLLSPTIASLQQYQFKFHSHPSSSSHGSLPSSRHPSEPPTLPQHSIYRFGSTSSASGYNLMSAQNSWPPSPTSSHHLPSVATQAGGMINGNGKYDPEHSQHSVSYGDEYDDVSELVDLPPGTHSGLPTGSAGGSSAKNIRRRSSKGAVHSLGISPHNLPMNGAIIIH